MDVQGVGLLTMIPSWLQMSRLQQMLEGIGTAEVIVGRGRREEGGRRQSETGGRGSLHQCTDGAAMSIVHGTTSVEVWRLRTVRMLTPVPKKLGRQSLTLR